MAIAIHRPVKHRIVRTPHAATTATIGGVLLLTLAITVALLATLLLAGDNPTSREPATFEVGYADAGSTVQLHSNDALVVTLEGNPSTGYSWEMVAGDAVLKQVDEPQFVADSTALGSAGKVILRFEAVAAGQSVLRLAYHRPFEKDIPPLRTFELTLDVGR